MTTRAVLFDADGSDREVELSDDPRSEVGDRQLLWVETRTAQRTNDVMKVLALASVVFLPGVVIAGIMGMNFRVGLFDQAGLFYVVIAAMAALGIATVVAARMRGWI
jgi:Mg2+ and Co2+ transporter CorA